MVSLSVCGRLNSRRLTAIGLGFMLAGLAIYQIDAIDFPARASVAVPLHALQGFMIGLGATVMFGALIRKRRGG